MMNCTDELVSLVQMDVSELTSHQAVDQPGVVTVNITQF